MTEQERAGGGGAFWSVLGAGGAVSLVTGTLFETLPGDHPLVRDLHATAPALSGIALVLLGLIALVACVCKAFFGRAWKRVKGDIERRGGLFLSRMDRRYRRHMLGVVRTIDPTGLDKGAEPVGFELDDVYVDVALDRTSPSTVTNDPFHSLEGQRRSLSHFLDGEERVVLAVVGPPGSGKTTLLRHTVRRLCRARGGYSRLPIPLVLGAHADAIAKDPDVSLMALFRGTLRAAPLHEPEGWFEQQLAEGRCVVLLDGLDEVAEEEKRRKVAVWVQKQTEVHHRNDFVLTSRPHGYRTNRINGDQVLRTQSFSSDQVSRYTHIRFQAHERLGGDPRGTPEQLLSRIWGQAALRELAINPMTLTMIVSVHLYHGELPESRAALYREMFQVVLWKRQKHVKNVEPRLSGEEQEKILGGLAFHMMEEGTRTRSRVELLEFLDESLLSDLLKCGAMVERESGEYAFAHQTFQEYLAADHMKREGLPEKDNLKSMVLDEWWNETLLLYSAMADADRIVRTALRSVAGANIKTESGFPYELNLQAMMLAHGCAELAPGLDPDLVSEIEHLLAQGLDPRAPELLTRLATQVYVRRDLQELVQLKNGVLLCTRPVSIDLYRHFLNKSRRRGEYRVPDDPKFVDEGPMGKRDPVRGLWYSDAKAFAAWVNGYCPGGERWRLPSVDEVISANNLGYLRNSSIVWAEVNASGEVVDPLGIPISVGGREEVKPSRDLRYHIENDMVDALSYILSAAGDDLVPHSLNFRRDNYIGLLRNAMKEKWGSRKLPKGAARILVRLINRGWVGQGAGQRGAFESLSPTERDAVVRYSRRFASEVLRINSKRNLVGDPSELAKATERVFGKAFSVLAIWPGPGKDVLAKTVREVFGREKPLTPGDASVARLYASAVSVASGSESALGRHCWEIVEALTLLQMRQAGEIPAEETIILVRD